MTGRVLCVGEMMVSLRAHGRMRLGSPLTMSVAGAEGNVAIGLARLGHAVSFAGAVGTDELGELVLRTLRAEGVAVDCVRRDPTRPTGVMFREQRTGDVVHVDYVRKGSAGSAIDDDAVAAALAAPPPSLLHISGVTAALSPTAAQVTATALRLARDAGAVTSLDVNYRRRLWSRDEASAALTPLLAQVDVLFASGDEVELVFPGGEVRVGEGPREIVVTHGAAGAEAWAGDEHTRHPARTVRAVDVVGAGDAFVAGYLSARLDGLDVAHRLARGTEVAAVAVTTDGDWEGLPTRAELEAFGTDHGGTLR